MSRILVIRRGGLGDTLLTVPLLRALRRTSEGASLHLAGNREFCDIPCAYGTVDVAHSAEDLWLWVPERARQCLQGFDLVLGDEPDCVHQPLDLRGGGAGVPFALHLARAAGYEPRWPQDCQLLPPRDLVGGAVLIAPGSGGSHKCWPREHWLGLAQRLSRRGHPLKVLVGPVERERDDPRKWPWPGGCLDFVVEEQPARLARRIESSSVFVGNDSGPTHLAAMLGVPTVAVFVATDPTIWAPVGAHVHVIGAAAELPSIDGVDGLLDEALAWRG